MSDIKEWTLMFYFASDNPLAPSIVSQLKAIKDAGFHADANVIARFDPHPLNTPAHIFEVNLINKLKANGKSNVGFTANDPFVRTLVSDKLWRDDKIIEKIRKALNEPNRAAGATGIADAETDLDEIELDETRNGSPSEKKEITFAPAKPTKEMSAEQTPKASLGTFLQFCKKEYTARHYMLFILGHGVIVGNDLFLFDEHTAKQPNVKEAAEHSLLLKDLREILENFNKAEEGPSRKLDVICFHSCSMSGLEVAYELRDTAKYMLASQGPAFVGSWPYRNLLLRVFNDLEAPSIRRRDLTNPVSLIEKLKTGANPLSSYLLKKFPPETIKMITEFNSANTLDGKLIDAVVDALNGELNDPGLRDSSLLEGIALSAETTSRLAGSPEGLDLKWLNRRLLEDAFPTELSKSPKRQTTVKQMLVRMFFYILYNSYDFQMAGYSFDVCLSDLEKMGAIRDPLMVLSDKLLTGVSDPIARKFILLAHLEAQSYWQENYTDLYDFCYRLEQLCLPKPSSGSPGNLWLVNEQASGIVKDIGEACGNVMEVLRRGARNDDDRIVIRSEYAGPAFQYSHGFSVFFPWSQPRDTFFWNTEEEQDKNVEEEDSPAVAKREVTGYKSYKFAETNWDKFLDAYFKETMRQVHTIEIDDREPKVTGPSLDEDLLDEISHLIFNEAGQLKVGPRDVTGKDGPHDPAGAECDCGTVKNYPPFTRTRSSRNFFQQGTRSFFR